MQDATRIKMQRGSKCNEDQDATRIKMHFLILSQFFNEMKKNEEESFLSSVKCKIPTVVLRSSFLSHSHLYLKVGTLENLNP